ncbi:hypothetical protein AB0K53_00895 [Streptomyces tuirus]|uniref:hypothetical protein n=1 Tax=Streptomyces tuirus TaxID=68278 RepID=UPI00344709B8
MTCTGGLPSCGPAVARWQVQNGYWFLLCQSCLDAWFDNADDDDDLEPAAWSWIEKRRVWKFDSMVILPDPPHVAEAIRDLRRYGVPTRRR